MINNDKNYNQHIMVIDDDDRLRKLLQKYLTENNFKVTTASCTKEADELMNIFRFDLIVADVMMPEEDGFSFVKRIRAKDSIPILMLTAMNETTDRINGLECGADDYLPKPFEPKELVLRILSILKRIPEEKTDSPRMIKIGNCICDTKTGALLENGNKVHLTPTETTLLKSMSEKLGQVISREELAEITGAGENLRTVDVQITRLRKKIEPDTKIPHYLQTIRGKGYMLLPD